MRKGLRDRALTRMDDIVAHYAHQPGVLAVAAFGSNADRTRFDDYSDLDFLVFVEAYEKDRLLREIIQLECLCPIDGAQIVYTDAVQLLFSDGVFCDFGIILPEQLNSFPHGAGRYLWARDGWNAVDLRPSEPPRKTAQQLETNALFHLYIGLLRAARGEKAAAFYEIQLVAAQDILALMEENQADAFSTFRRAESLVTKEVLGDILPGYSRSKEAASAMLSHLQHRRHTSLYRAVLSLLD